jgi:hypothetical protein
MVRETYLRPCYQEGQVYQHKLLLPREAPGVCMHRTQLSD